MKQSTSILIVGICIGVVISSVFYSWLYRVNLAERDRSSVRVLQVAHVLPQSHPVHAGMEYMAQRVDELSRGALELQIFPGGQLGGETQCLEQVQAGSLAITKVSAAPLGSFVSRMQVFSLPYVFHDVDHYWRVLDGPLGQSLLAELNTHDSGEPSGFHGLCYYDAGARNFYAKKPIQNPEDLTGLKIRVVNDPVAMDVVEALGGSPTPIAYGELYTALKQGVVDGAENNEPSFVSSRHYEICKHYALDAHTRIPDVLIISQVHWEALSDQEQRWLSQAANESSRHQRALWKVESRKALETMKNEGVQVYQVDGDAFRARSASVRRAYGTGAMATLLEQIEHE